MTGLSGENTKFRKEIPQKEMYFLFNLGGIGDYICFLTSIMWIKRNYPYIKGTVVVPDYFIEVAQNIVGDWRVMDRELISTIQRSNHLKIVHMLPVNATQMHLVDLGFLYFAEQMPPKEVYYEDLELNDVKLKSCLKNLDYVVMTPGATAKNREMSPKTFNEIKDHILSKGLKPVFLGNTKIGGVKGKQYTSINEGYDLRGGINLLNKTTLLEAAKIIDQSKLIVGIDNGLLHLAGMTTAPIVFGYTMTGPKQREPKRKKGTIINVVNSKKELSCRHCQETHKFFEKHSFTTCFYDDYKCIDLMTSDKFIKAIDLALE